MSATFAIYILVLASIVGSICYPITRNDSDYKTESGKYDIGLYIITVAFYTFITACAIWAIFIIPFE